MNMQIIDNTSNIPMFRDCTNAITMYGDNMSPSFKSGDIIFIKPWNEKFIDYGCCYLIITQKGYKMVRRINKGSDDSHVLIFSDNQHYQPFEIPLSDIYQLYIVKGRIGKTAM